MLLWQPKQAPPNVHQDRAARDRSEAKSILDVCDLQVSYGRGARALQAIGDISLSVDRGEFVTVVGPSGCGKTTLLKVLSGLLPATTGSVRIEDRLVEGPPKNLALVFQDYTRSLLPWLSVIKNVTFPLASRGETARVQYERGRSALVEVGLSDFENHYPWQLSGGMQQRVAIARAIAYRPVVLLMDEPFAAVDAQTRAELEDLILRVHRDLKVTVLLVTHDIDESIYLGNRVVVLSSRPTTVRKSLDVDLAYPRDQVETKANPKFVELRTIVSQLIRDERKTSAHVNL